MKNLYVCIKQILFILEFMHVLDPACFAKPLTYQSVKYSRLGDPPRVAPVIAPTRSA